MVMIRADSATSCYISLQLLLLLFDNPSFVLRWSTRLVRFFEYFFKKNIKSNTESTVVSKIIYSEIAAASGLPKRVSRIRGRVLFVKLDIKKQKNTRVLRLSSRIYARSCLPSL